MRQNWETAIPAPFWSVIKNSEMLSNNSHQVWLFCFCRLNCLAPGANRVLSALLMNDHKVLTATVIYSFRNDCRRELWLLKLRTTHFFGTLMADQIVADIQLNPKTHRLGD